MSAMGEQFTCQDQRSSSKTTLSPSVGKASQVLAPVMLAPMDLH